MRKGNYLRLSIWILMLCVSLAVPVARVEAQTKKQIGEAKKLASEGDTLYRQKNYQAAIAKYQEAIKNTPNYPYAYFSKGYSHFYLKEYDQALADLNTAFEQKYTPIEVYKIRWLVYYTKKDYDSALKDIQAGLSIEPSNGTLYAAEGDIYRDQNLDKQALDAYTKAAQFDTNNPDIPYYIAFASAKLGDYPQQGAASLKAVEKGTKYPGEAWFLRGDSLQRDRKFEEAAEAYERAIAAKPSLVDAYNNLASVYQSLNKLDKGIEILKKGLQANPDNGALYTSMSWLYSLNNRHADAIIAAKQAVKFAPDQYMGYTNLCRAYNDTTQYDPAIEACLNALKLNPDDGESNFYLARAYDFQSKKAMAQDRYKKALPGMLELTKNNPDYADGFYILGNVYTSLDKRPEAIEAYKKTIALSPKFTRAMYNLGYVYVQDGNKKLARGQYDEILKIDPELAGKLLQVIEAK